MTPHTDRRDTRPCLGRSLGLVIAGLALLSACGQTPTGAGAAGHEAPEAPPAGTAPTTPLPAPPPTAGTSSTTAASPATTTTAPATVAEPTTTSSSTSTTTTTTPPVGWIALTFDDGPVAGTRAILDVLDAYGVKATFFALGSRVAAHPEMAREIVARGHSLQSHGYGHGRWTEMSNSALRRDLERANGAILAATGMLPTCARPPWGLTNRRTTAVVESLGMEVIMWDEDPSDYLYQNGLRLVAQAGDWKPNSVVIGHDTHHAVWAPVLTEIIEGLQGRGLELVAVCAPPPPPPPRLPTL